MRLACEFTYEQKQQLRDIAVSLKCEYAERYAAAVEHAIWDFNRVMWIQPRNSIRPLRCLAFTKLPKTVSPEQGVKDGM